MHSDYSKYREYQREYQKKFYRKKHLKRLYGITTQDYFDMLHKQESRCAICNTHRDDLSRDLALDHCHKTGQIRKLLCQKCNVGLGMFNDDENLIVAALSYLKEFK